MINLKKRLEKLPSRLNAELIFYIGIFFLPFENFFFAPSVGWATISPLIFAIYLLLKPKETISAFLKLRRIFVFFITAIILGSLTAFLNNVNTVDFFNAFIPLFLGAISLLSFFVFYEKTKDLSKVVNIVVIAYAICAVIGLFEFLALKLNNFTFTNFLEDLFKRSYLKNDRVQFFFTEPSFIGMHLFGVLLPLYWLSRRKDLLFIIGLFIVEAIAFESGVRVIIDIAVVAALYFTYLLFINKKAKFIPLILLILGLGFSFAYNQNYRFKKIVDNGVYSDGSFASRYFRVQASVIGYAKTPAEALVGYGLGNSIKPIHVGYDEAYAAYDSDYKREVEAFDNIHYHDDAASYCLYTRFISEFGLIMTIVAIVFLISLTRGSILPQKWLYFAIILYLYIQFESLGFYALWFFITTMYFTNEKRMTTRSLLARISDNVIKRKKNEKRKA